MAFAGFAGTKGSASVQSIVTLVAAASSPRRARLLEFSFGSDASPADNAFTLQVQRCTTAGTGTARTPNMDDPADSLASTIVVTDTVTADGTLTAGAFLWQAAWNQRSSMRVVLPPGAELVIPATASNGLALVLAAATTTTFRAGGQFLEL